LLTLGTRGQAGQINQPTDVAVGATAMYSSLRGIRGTNGDPRVVKFDGNGTFIKSWGGKGKGPGQFDVAHGIAIDANGGSGSPIARIQRIQIFDQERRTI